MRIDAHVIDLKHVKLDCLSYVKREGWQVLNIYDCIISYFLEMLANSWFLRFYNINKKKQLNDVISVKFIVLLLLKLKLYTDLKF